MPNKAAGPDQLPPWVLKMFATKLTPVLTLFHYFSLQSIRGYYHRDGSGGSKHL